jgi:hypothetical protein
MTDTSAKLAERKRSIGKFGYPGQLLIDVLKDFDPDFVSFRGSYFDIFDGKRLA